MRKALFTNLMRTTHSTFSRGTLFYSSYVSENALLIPQAIEKELNTFLHRLTTSEELYEASRDDLIREIKKDIKIGQLLLEKYDMAGAKNLFASLLGVMEKSKINDKNILSQILMNYGLALKNGGKKDSEIAEASFQKVIALNADHVNDASKELQSIKYDQLRLDNNQSFVYLDESSFTKNT